MVTEGPPRTRLVVDRDRAALAGVGAADVTRAVATLYGGADAGVLRAPARGRGRAAARAPGAGRARRPGGAGGAARRSGAETPLSELTRVERDSTPPEIHHKNMHRVVYVLGETAGREESPVYAIANLRPRIAALTAPDGLPVHQLSTRLPDSDEGYALKWDGEWHVTYEVFRDMGAAFAVVLVLIYILTVGWFRSFVTPLVIMLPIPLQPRRHPARARAVRRLLHGDVDDRLHRRGGDHGAQLDHPGGLHRAAALAGAAASREAVIDAGAVRFRPMVLTAAAVVVGSGVILFDPIFQGLAVALMGGEVAATLLSRVAVPVLYYLTNRKDEGR